MIKKEKRRLSVSSYGSKLVWVLAFGGALLVFVMLVSFNFLIQDIKQTRDALYQKEERLREDVLDSKSVLIEGEKEIDRLLIEGKSKYLEGFWIASLKEFFDKKGGIATFSYLEKPLDDFRNQLSIKSNLVNTLNEWSEQKQKNLVEIDQAERKIQNTIKDFSAYVDKKVGKSKIKEAMMVRKYRKSNDEEAARLSREYIDYRVGRIDFSSFELELAELKITFEKLRSIDNHSNLKDYQINIVTPILDRLKKQINSLEDDVDRVPFESFLGALSQSFLQPDNAQAASNYFDLLSLRINIEKERKEFVLRNRRSFAMLNAALNNLAFELENMIVDFDVEANLRFENLLRRSTDIALIGGVLYFLLALVISRLIQAQTNRINNARREAEVLTRRAEEAAQAKSDFLANMSHEIRTPMNAILGFGDLLNKTKLDEKQRSYLNSVQTSGDLLVGIIDDILDISKLESGKIALEMKDVHLERLIHDVFKMITTRMKDNPFDTFIDIDSNVPAVIKTDPTRLKQVFVNLLGNAIKFTTQGEIGVIARISDKPVDEGRVNIEFTVKDTGVGIPEEKLSKIFESFTQADESTTRKFGGIGLGLTITKAIVEAMGGSIHVESEVGKGSRFILTIPFGISSLDVSGLSFDGQVLVKDKTVFIVDDNQTSLRLLERCCQSLDLKNVGLSQSPNEALHKLDKLIEIKGIVPDVIVSDLIMDGMSGFQLIEKIKGNPKFKDTVFIAVTADIKAESEHDSEKQLFNAYVTKPVSTDSLINAFNSVLGSNIESVDEGLIETDDACRGVRLIIVEDVLPNQLLMGEYLKQLGSEFVFANNGQEAVDILRGNSDFDLCLMDLQMPVMGGVEATRIIRKEITKDLPIIALTAAVLEEDKRSATEAGMNEFMAKPVSIDSLKDTIIKYRKKSV